MNHLQIPLFYIFALTAISSAIVVIKDRRPAYGVLALAITMLALSGLFVLLQAYFVAVIQVLIYAGAILVLFLFVIMLLGVSGSEKMEETFRKNKVASIAKVGRGIKALLLLLLLAELITVILAFQGLNLPRENFQGTVEAIGIALFTNYLFPFELVSGILLIGIFGVVNLAQKELGNQA